MIDLATIGEVIKFNKCYQILSCIKINCKLLCEDLKIVEIVLKIPRAKYLNRKILNKKNC